MVLPEGEEPPAKLLRGINELTKAGGGWFQGGLSRSCGNTCARSDSRSTLRHQRRWQWLDTDSRARFRRRLYLRPRRRWRPSVRARLRRGFQDQGKLPVFVCSHRFHFFGWFVGGENLFWSGRVQWVAVVIRSLVGMKWSHAGMVGRIAGTSGTAIFTSCVTSGSSL